MWIQLVAGIPERLELAKGIHQLRSEHLRQQRTTRLAISMLNGERSAIAHDQIGRPIDESGVLSNSHLALQIETDLHVDTSVAEMTVVGRVVPVLVQQPPEISQE